MQPNGDPGPQKREYEPRNLEQAVGYLVEECGEVLQAVGKIQRYGWDSRNPDLPPMQQISNARALRQEMRDLEAAIYRVRKFMDSDLDPDLVQ